jgi:hypothetical protein
MSGTNNIKTLSLRYIAEKSFLTKEMMKALNALIASPEWKNNPSFKRAAARAVKRLSASPFWSFDGQVLRVVSPVSGIKYAGIKADSCICESFLSNHGFCWHRAAFILLKTMAEQTETGANNEFALNVGDRFRIRGNVYKGKTFVVESIYGAGNLSCSCPEDKGTVYAFPAGSLAYYGNKVQILSRAETPEGKSLDSYNELPYLPPASNRKPETVGGARV